MPLEPYNLKMKAWQVAAFVSLGPEEDSSCPHSQQTLRHMLARLNVDVLIRGTRRCAGPLCVRTMSRRKGRTPTPTERDQPEKEGRMLDRGVMKPYKLCAQCQKPMVQRAKWKDNWDEVKFCSDRCRRDSKSNRSQPPAGETQPD